MFLNCSTCFGRHTAHHQELKAVTAASGFTYVLGCRPLRWLSHRSGLKPKTYVKPEAAITVFELLMMGSLSPETCWAIKKQWNNKLYHTVASCWFFLWVSYYDARIRFWFQAAAMAEPLQRPETKNVCKTRGCNYSFWAPDDGRVVARNMLSN